MKAARASDDEQIYRETIRRGLGWLKEHEQELMGVDDLAAHYKAPYLYAVTGDPLRARRYADWMQNRYQQPDGDFCTGPGYKGWAHLPSSPANRYLYSNGWIIVALRKLGYYRAAAAGIEFVKVPR